MKASMMRVTAPSPLWIKTVQTGRSVSVGAATGKPSARRVPNGSREGTSIGHKQKQRLTLTFGKIIGLARSSPNRIEARSMSDAPDVTGRRRERVLPSEIAVGQVWDTGGGDLADVVE